MSPSSAKRVSRAAGAALAALVAAVPAPAAEVRLDVGGDLEQTALGLLVRVEVTNRGDSAAGRLEVEGELFGSYAETSLPAGIRPGKSENVWLQFPLPPPRPGVHALALHLRYPLPGSSEGASQRAYLLLALGAQSEPAVRLSVQPATFETTGALQVRMESADGRPHQVRVRVLAPRGVNALAEAEATVPAQGSAVASVPLIRTGPSRAERQGVVVLAASTAEGVENTVAATSTVDLVPHRPWMPRLRIPIVVAGVILLLAAAALELRRRAP